MLEKLNVINGRMVPPFDKYNNMYTVYVNEDVTKLDLEYDSDIDIEISGNDNLINSKNTILITTKDMIYNLTVLKETNDAEVFLYADIPDKVEIEKPISQNTIILIIIICLFLILLTHHIIFRKKHK